MNAWETVRLVEELVAPLGFRVTSTRPSFFGGGFVVELTQDESGERKGLSALSKALSEIEKASKDADREPRLKKARA